MKRGYSADKSSDLRKVKPEIIVFVMLIIVFFGVIIYIYLDLNKNNLTVDNTKNQEVLGVYEVETYPYRTVETNDFKVDIPEPWIRIVNPEIRISGKTFYPVRFQGVEKSEVGRRIDIYFDTFPAKLPANKILTVEVNNSSISSKLLSPQCYTFTKFPDTQKGEPFDTSWMGHNFTCLTARQSNTIVAVENNFIDGIVLERPDGSLHTVMFSFTDHSGNSNNAIFNRILESFRLK